MLTEEEIEGLVSKQSKLVKLTKHNLVDYLIYKIALERAYKNLYKAERNILEWNMDRKRRFSR